MALNVTKVEGYNVWIEEMLCLVSSQLLEYVGG